MITNPMITDHMITLRYYDDIMITLRYYDHVTIMITDHSSYRTLSAERPLPPSRRLRSAAVAAEAASPMRPGHVGL